MLYSSDLIVNGCFPRRQISNTPNWRTVNVKYKKNIIFNHPVATVRSHDFSLSKYSCRSCDKIVFLPDANISEHLTF